MGTRYSSAVIRRAVIKSVNYSKGTAYTRWLDEDSDGPEIPIPHPFGNRGGSGIFVGISVGTIVVLSMAAYKNYIPVAVLPVNAYYSDDDSSIGEADFDDISYPHLSSGDIVIQGSTGSLLSLNNGIEEILLNNEYGEGIKIGGGNDSFRCSMLVQSPTNYVIGQQGFKASGIVRRDIKIEDNEESFADYLFSLESEQSLEEVGWNPNKQVTYTNSGLSKQSKTNADLYRNPAFVEDRQVIFEFGRDWRVGSIPEEKERLNSSCIPVPSYTYRSERRNNALGLSLANPNELIETISGTVVDIFGNPLDINRKVIDLPSGELIEDILDDTFEKVRHTIAYHMEINTRKGIRYDHKDNKKPEYFKNPLESIHIISNNARDRSKWSLDIDKEGLTKINIPATSETGNVPMITRYENSSVLKIDENGNYVLNARNKIEDTKKLYHNKKNRDIFTEQVGPGGIKVSTNAPDNRVQGKKTSWANATRKEMGATVEVGTAFHDIAQTAESLITENINKKASDIIFNGPKADVSGLTAISREINNTVYGKDLSDPTRQESGLLNDQPNAGGRSVHVSLDGSMEMSVGATTIDRVSWVLDTAGAIVCRLGRDRAGRSAIIQADGTIALEVGGYDYVGESSNDDVDTRFVGKGVSRDKILKLDPNQFRSGKVIIKVQRATPNNKGPEEEGALLVIDETGITITTAGRFNLISDQDMSFISKSRIIIDAPKVQVYSKNPKYFARTSRIIK